MLGCNNNRASWHFFFGRLSKAVRLNFEQAKQAKSLPCSRATKKICQISTHWETAPLFSYEVIFHDLITGDLLGRQMSAPALPLGIFVDRMFIGILRWKSQDAEVLSEYNWNEGKILGISNCRNPKTKIFQTEIQTKILGKSQGVVTFVSTVSKESASLPTHGWYIFSLSSFPRKLSRVYGTLHYGSRLWFVEVSRLGGGGVGSNFSPNANDFAESQKKSWKTEEYGYNYTFIIKYFSEQNLWNFKTKVWSLSDVWKLCHSSEKNVYLKARMWARNIRHFLECMDN